MSRVSEIRYIGYGVPGLATERTFYNVDRSTGTAALRNIDLEDSSA